MGRGGGSERKPDPIRDYGRSVRRAINLCTDDEPG